MLKFYVKVFYVMGKALSGELSCPCDRSCLFSDLGVKVAINRKLKSLFNVREGSDYIRECTKSLQLSSNKARSQ